MLAAIYCVIPYKPPWCALGILEGIVLLAGIEEKTSRRWLMVAMFELRPQLFVELCVEAGLREGFLARRAGE